MSIDDRTLLDVELKLGGREQEEVDRETITVMMMSLMDQREGLLRRIKRQKKLVQKEPGEHSHLSLNVCMSMMLLTSR